MTRTTAQPKRRAKKSPAAKPAAPGDHAVPDAPEPVAILKVSPLVEGGRYPLKRVTGEDVRVSADLLKDGHDCLAAVLQWRTAESTAWSETPMRAAENDRWEGVFPVGGPGFTDYRIMAWGDVYASWAHDMAKRIAGGQADLSSEALEGATLLEAAAARATGQDAAALRGAAALLHDATSPADLSRVLDDPVASALASIYTDRSPTAVSHVFRVRVDRPAAAFAAWYEFFPRSAEGKPDAGSTFRTCLGRIDDARAMGFDVVYFPPIHPIGITKRKGRNNSLACQPGDPGVPYAIGNRSEGVNGGGHRDVAPELGTLDDFTWLVGEIRARGMEVALDFAINCSPDHPYVADHPQWFFQRPDGSIKYAENPPKKYEDVYPLNFHNPDWKALWREMRDVLAFWCGLGVRIFRVDNPHTKPVAFWEWVIADIQRDFPDTIFLSEAFTRPKMMRLLAKAGFTQSYTYFTWRNTKWELESYLDELAHGPMAGYFRPNFFTNTPDILPFFLQQGGRPAFCIRAVLAATLSPLYGIYSGFELCENTPVPEREEYLDSEKYHFKGRDWNAPGNIKELLTSLNTIRRENRALHRLDSLRFLPAENENILFFAKTSPACDNILLIATTLDPFNRQTAFVNVPVADFGIPEGSPYLVDDLLTGETFRWSGSRNFIALDPWNRPAHILRVRRWSGRFHGRDVFV
jgi:starch synthase (maltosyl-transferring)